MSDRLISHIGFVSRNYGLRRCKACDVKFSAKSASTEYCIQCRDEGVRWKKYGTNAGDLEVLLLLQNFACAICTVPFRKHKRTGRLDFKVDHDHQTNVVRELLCNRCNIMVGWAESQFCDSVLRYVEKHKDPQHMSTEQKAVQMHVIAPGKAASDGEFVFELQPRSNGARVVRFSLKAQDAESVKKAVEAYLKELK